MTALPSFTVTGSLFDLLGNVVGSELAENGLGGGTPASVTFTSNVPANKAVVWEGRIERVRPVVAKVASDGTLSRNGDTVRLLANDAGLNVTGLQWRVDITGLAAFTFDAPTDGGTVDLATVIPAPNLPVVGVPVDVGAWADITGRPAPLVAGGNTAGGYPVLDGGGKIASAQLPISIMDYKGVWNASTNSPTLVDGTGSTGDVYRVGTGASRNLGSGSITFDVGDYAIYNGSTWEKSDTTDAVASVAGLTGVISSSGLKTALSVSGATVVNVKDSPYNAVGDGVANDTAAIHAARTAAGVGGAVFFPPGTYLAGALALNVADQRWLLPGATLKFAGPGTVDFLTITATGVSVVGGTLDLSSVTKNTALLQSQGIIVRSGGSGAVIRDVTVKDSPGHGIFALDANKVTVTGCTITDQEFYGIHVATSADSVHIADYLIHGNLISTSSTVGRGIYLRNDNTTRSISRARISNNTVVLPTGSGSGVFPECIVAFYSLDCVIDNNITYGGWAGISFGGLTRSTVSNNTCRGFWAIGIEIATGQTKVTVTGNTIDADGHGEANVSGIQCSDGAVTNVAISGNTISGFTVGPCQGIFFGSGSKLNGVAVSGNTITSAVTSGQFVGIYSNDDITNLAVTGNVIDAASSAGSLGMLFASGAYTGLVITGNSLSNLAVAALYLYVAGTGTFSNIRFTGNGVRNCGAAVTSDVPITGTSIICDSISTGTVASAAGTITLPLSGDILTLTGTATVTSITASYPGRRVTLINTSTASLADGGNLKLSGAGPATADDTITLVCDGTNWFEVGRSAN